MDPTEINPAAAAAAGTGSLVLGLLFYLYFALCLYIIAKKCGVDLAWMAWVPILQVVPLLQAAGKPIWWILLMLVPLVNVIVAIVVWMGIAEARGKAGWIGVLMIVPGVNLIVPAYLAFAD